MGMVKSIIYISLFVSFSSCKFIFGEDEKLTKRREEYHGRKLRVDGYYYRTSGVYTIYFLYRNGVIFELGSYLPAEIQKSEHSFNNIEMINSIKEKKYSWGIFRIKNDSIEYEKWFPANGPSKLVYVRKGKILNDTTFVITQLMRYDGSESESCNEIYHFKKIAIKPDSINVFIK